MLDEVLGWFPQTDHILFDWILGHAPSERGDLLEIGTYHGRTAIFMGRYLRPGERLVVCDLFGTPALTPENQAEMRDYRAYGSAPTAETFLATYRAFHSADPVVHRMDSALLADHVDRGSCRFIHVDASHLYQQVSSDLRCAGKVAATGGVLVVDDYRGRMSPGVGAAVWETVFGGGLKPLWLTDQKFYGTWGDHDALQDAFFSWAPSRSQLSLDEQRIAGYRVARVTHLGEALRRARETSLKRWPLRGSLDDIACR